MLINYTPRYEQEQDREGHMKQDGSPFFFIDNYKDKKQIDKKNTTPPGSGPRARRGPFQQKRNA